MKKLLLVLLCLPMIGFASFPINTNNTIQSGNNECDIITLKNGEEKRVKVIEISTKLIKYKDCDNQEGPLISIRKKDVVMIKYINGKNEVISTSSPDGLKKAKTRFINLVVGAAIAFGVVVVVVLFRGPA
jgi:hypothetical protein